MVVDDKENHSGEVVVGFEVVVGVVVVEVGYEVVGFEQHGFSKYAFPGSVPLRRTLSRSCIYGGW